MSNALNDFMPDDFGQMSDSKYWRPGQFKQGDTTFRIMQKPIAGWLEWHENKPLRYRPTQKPAIPKDPEKGLKKFWALYVWDYERKSMYILEITQGTILKELASLGSDQSWGDFTKYDIKIKKSGQGMLTKYNVMPVPHKNAPESAVMAQKSTPVNLEALYSGQDPYSFFEASERKIEPFPLNKASGLDYLNNKPK